MEAYGNLPLSFEANQGQADNRVKFLSRGAGYTFFLTPAETVLALRQPAPQAAAEETKPSQSVLRMQLVGANPSPLVTGLGELPGKSHYFLGNDPKKWRTNIANYAKVRYRSIYPGVDLVYYGNQQQLEYDIVVSPGADPGRIALRFQGADRLEVDTQGNLVLHTGLGEIQQRKPAVYQEVAGARHEISGGYVLLDSHTVGFQVGAYDRSRPLIIDPVLFYSTYLGGSDADIGLGIAVDATGNAYVTGYILSSNFPTTVGAFQTTFGGGNRDAFVTKLNPTGSGLVYSTYIGGNDFDFGYGIAVDASGSAYVTGSTSSTNFPTTPGAFQPTYGGNQDAFVMKLDPTGSALVYSTYLGGNQYDDGRSIAVDASGNAYVTGYTGFSFSNTFPTTAGAFQTTASGDYDAFVTKLNPTGSGLIYSTYLGGNSGDFGSGIAVDASGSAYVTGFTYANTFPTTAGAFQTTSGGSIDAFVTKISDLAAPAPTTLTLAPSSDTNPVNTQHCVTATVKDASGNPTPGITVRFTVTGSVNTTGSATTDANGQATFCYTGPALPGSDAITAYADTDNDNTQDAGEPSGAATKTWVLPVTTPLCTINIDKGGRITADNGDKATFGGNAKASATGATQGQEEYQDQGPVQRMNVKAINVLAIVCTGTTQASIYGQATINGSGSFFYRINVKDVGEPGVGRDTYWILLQNGYNSGEHTLEAGNIQIRRQ